MMRSIERLQRGFVGSKILPSKKPCWQVDFPPNEAQSKTIQKRVRRHPSYKQDSTARTTGNLPNEVPTTENMVNGGDDLSSLTHTTATTPNHSGNRSEFSPSSQSTKSITRKTVAQKQKHRVHKKSQERKDSTAMKEATRSLKREWDKNNSPDPSTPVKGARRIIRNVNGRHGTKLNYRTVTRYVSSGMIGVSPMKKGPEGSVPNKILKSLVSAIESYIRINQGNGKGAAIERKQLVQTVNNVAAPLFVVPMYSRRLLQRILGCTDVMLSAGVQNIVEDRRIRWTTYSNLKLWFDSWGEDIVELGFGYHDADGKVVISDDQLARILNLDESCLSLDGTKERRGGRLSSALFDQTLPCPGKTASKSSTTLTFIGGSNALVEALPQ